MAVVFPHRKLIAVPMPAYDKFEQLDKLFVTHTLKRDDGNDILVLPHHQDVVNILRNMKFNVDGCDMFDWYYDLPEAEGKTLWWWQTETAKFLASNPYSFVTSTPRTGKSLSTLTAIDYVQKQIGGGALIVAPLTTLGIVWRDACKEWFPNKKVVLIHKDREKEVAKPADIYLINPDGLKIVERQLKEKVDRGEIKIAVFDELTEFANVSSQRWKSANNVVKNCKYRWGLTGTPGAVSKIYGQVKLINPKRVPTTFFRWQAMTEVKVSEFTWRPRHGHEEIVKDAMSPCIRFDKEELMKIPTPKVIKEEVPLSEQQERLIKNLMDDFVAVVDSDAVEATTASTLAQKMLQVSNGVVRTKDGGALHVDASPKLDKLMEIIRRTPRKKVVFSSFTGVNDMLVDHIKLNGFTCEKIDGSVTGSKRAEILKNFLEAETPHVLVCHPRTTAFGVELASADTIICYGVPLTGAFMYQQMFERLSSTRQTATETFVYHLSAGKQDRISFNALANGVNIERNIVNLFTTRLKELSD